MEKKKKKRMKQGQCPVISVDNVVYEDPLVRHIARERPKVFDGDAYLLTVSERTRLVRLLNLDIDEALSDSHRIEQYVESALSVAGDWAGYRG